MFAGGRHYLMRHHCRGTECVFRKASSTQHTTIADDIAKQRRYYVEIVMKVSQEVLSEWSQRDPSGAAQAKFDCLGAHLYTEIVPCN